MSVQYGKWCLGSDTAVAQAIVSSMAHRFASGNAKIKVGRSTDLVRFGRVWMLPERAL
jgi:hypothetical protein